MAAYKPKKPAASKRKPSENKNAEKKHASKKPIEKSALRVEVICIIIIAAALLMALGLLSENGAGFLGGFVKGFLAGLFGIGAYILPFAMITGSLVTLFGKVKAVSVTQIIMSCALFLIVISFAYILKGSYPEYDGILQYISQNYKSGGVSNGGLIGAAIGGALLKVLGGGAYILLIAAGAVLLILITGKSLFALIARCFAYFDTRFKQKMMARAEEYSDDDEYEDEYERIEGKTSKPVFDYTVTEAPSPAEGERLSLANEDLRRAVRPSAAESKVIEFKKPASLQTKIRDSFQEHLDMRELAPDAEGETADELEPDGVFAYESVAGFGDTLGEAFEPNVLEFEDDLPPWVDVPAAGTDDETEISVRGTGVEGYKAKAVDAEGEIVDERKFAIITEPPKTEHTRTDEYVYPPIELLKENPYVPSLSSKAHILENSRKLEETLKSFGVEAKVVEVCKGPTVTRYELSPGVGVKVSKISGLADDLALNLAAVGIRIEAPVPGKSVVGIEIPNKEAQSVFLREVIDDEAFWSYPSKICFAIGKDIAGNTVIADIAKMPHLLIAGATGSGKSVCINTLIASIVYKANPNEVKLLMVDPKVVELSVYNGIPHLLIPVVTDPKKAAGALNWAVREMESRYNMFAENMVRDLKGYNAVKAENGETPLPQIVIIIDELADLMMTCGKEVEESICRLAQKARAAGLHLIIATQRPSVDVITGLIKANVPSRLAFAVSSGTDSRTILDMVGAEKLLGKGDMLFSPVGLSKPQRIQGSFISDKEVENLVNFIKRDQEQEYDPEMIERITAAPDSEEYFQEGSDELTDDAIEFLVSKEKASVSMLQRKFRIGYNRAARLMAELEDRGIVGPEDGSKPRKVLMTSYQWRDYKERRENIEY